MNTGKTVFSQVMDYLPWRNFRRQVERYKSNYRVKNFSCTDQFLCMAFAQLTFRESLRDIEACLRASNHKLYHLGIRGNVSRSTLADANNNRDWRLYADIAQTLIQQAKNLYMNDDLGLDLDNAIYALDSTTIDLCLALFPWAQYSPTQAGIRLHTILNLRGSIPSFIDVVRVKGYSECLVLDQLIPEPGAFYVMDRGYLSFKRLYMLDQSSAFFVIRSRNKILHRRVYSQTVDKSLGLRSDQTVTLTGSATAIDYPDKIRRIVVHDKEHDNRIILFTNHAQLPAHTITELYKQRWKIELFFKWIKQHLRIKAFFGTSENAVKTQIWIAISTYLLVAIIKKRLKLDAELYTILQILSVSAFEKIDLARLLDMKIYKTKNNNRCNQLQLFN